MSPRKRKTKQNEQRIYFKSFNCPSCGATLNITAAGTTVSVICKSCQATIDANDPNYKILEEAGKKRRVKDYVPLGARGRISGVLYECIGFMQREDSGYRWKEYLLFNPYYGYRWLFEMNGHWSFIKKVYDPPLASDGTPLQLKYKGKKFKIYNSGKATVDYVEGEFYWRVKKGDKANMVDYVAPPYMLSRESTNDETIWSLATYIEQDRIQKIFNIKTMPDQYGVAPNQPSPYKARFKEAFKVMTLTMFCLFMIYSIRSVVAKKEVVFKNDYTYKRKGGIGLKELKTEHFVINNDRKNLKLKAYSNVRNDWIYIDALLVDAKTGKGIPLPVEISYYRGADWSEGSQNATNTIFNVPKGEYFLNIKHQSNYKKNNEIYYKYSLVSDVVISRDFYFALVILILWPIFLFWRSTKFEMHRWQDSSFSPYDTGE